MKGGKQGLRIMGLRFKFEGLRWALVMLFVFQSILLFAQKDTSFPKNSPKAIINIYDQPLIFKVVSIDSFLINSSPNSYVNHISNKTSSRLFSISPIGLKVRTLDTKVSNKPINSLAEELEDSIINQSLTGKIVCFSGSSSNKKRIRLMTLANVAGYSLATYGFYNAWYKNQPTTSFHFFNDNAEWLQVDKAGHVYGAYIGSRASMELWRWTGISRNKRIWLGGLSGLAFQTIIETFDGFGKDWGWSWGDVGANAFGSGLLMGQEFLWNEQRIDVKFSFHRRNYNEPMLSERADSLYGTSILNRMVKDYNGQTYWLSANIKSFFPKANVPSWLNIAVGYGAEGMFEGRKNIWKDRNGNTIDRTDIDRYRQWYIAPDINLTKIKTKSKILKTVLFFFNSFKFPLPSIGFSKKGIEWNWIHF